MHLKDWADDELKGVLQMEGRLRIEEERGKLFEFEVVGLVV
jgi:hypothetical protein